MGYNSLLPTLNSVSTIGLILRTRPLTETSLIVHWLTPDLGRVATVAKGARRPKSPFRGKLDLFYEADFSFARSRRSELHTLREVSLRQTHSRLRENLHALQQAAYCTALLEQTTETETPLPTLYALFRALLAQVASGAGEPRTVLAFEAKLLVELGQQPDASEAKLSPGSRQIYARLEAEDWPALALLKLSSSQETELRQFLHGFLIYHLGRIPKGRGDALAGA
ncbi:MAG: repair protein RecO [Verrucomicrobiota bacterium]